MKATIITVTYNSDSTLSDYAKGLIANESGIERVVIVDNGSTDSTVAHLSRLRTELPFPVTVVQSSNDGFAGGYATASTYVVDRGPVLCLNPDVALAPQVVADMTAAMSAHQEFGILTAPLLDETGSPDSASVRRLPKLGTATLYAAIGRFTPRRWRYNAPPEPRAEAEGSNGVRRIEATTGALMLVNPEFRDPQSPIFDTAYWMYGEDLQLCFDATQSGWGVGMVATGTSTHSKGASSGKPRRLRSNVAFHRAMYTYYAKNLKRSPAEAVVVAGGVVGRGSLSILGSSATRGWRKVRRVSLDRSGS
ncbi:GT2 family glycosyltransferase [Humibacillus xanthopallidus]|uniref:GT2 family glycosyltransferase n=1 Tax=Humibacillus xanthopallidus TaxID=412689 RepID=A0A543PXI8_9MICO|nr:glycosyltransferase [Humibacillus xanthopallidus]TQN48794.1 GT2 family glycosyltransferase [Humibacillus xanthopallidus]